MIFANNMDFIMNIPLTNNPAANSVTRSIEEVNAAKTIQGKFRAWKASIDEKVSKNTQSDSLQNNYVKLVSRQSDEVATYYYIPKLGISLKEPTGNVHSNKDTEHATIGNEKKLYKKDDNFVLLEYKNKDIFNHDWSDVKTAKLLELNLKLINQKTLYFSYPLSSTDSPSGTRCVIARNAGPSLLEIASDKEYYKKNPRIEITEFKQLILDLAEVEKTDLLLPDLHCKNITRKRMSDGSYRINAIDIDCITKGLNMMLHAPQDCYPFNIKDRYRVPQYAQHFHADSVKVIQNTHKFMMLINMALSIDESTSFKENWENYCLITERCTSENPDKQGYLSMLDKLIIPNLDKIIKPEYRQDVINFLRNPEKDFISTAFHQLFNFM